MVYCTNKCLTSTIISMRSVYHDSSHGRTTRHDKEKEAQPKKEHYYNSICKYSKETVQIMENRVWVCKNRLPCEEVAKLRSSSISAHRRSWRCLQCSTRQAQPYRFPHGAHDDDAVCKNDRSEQYSSVCQHSQSAPWEERRTRHRSLIQIQCNVRRRLESLQNTISFQPFHHQKKRLTSIQSTTAATSGACSKNCSPSSLTRITFFLFT